MKTQYLFEQNEWRYYTDYGALLAVCWVLQGNKQERWYARFLEEGYLTIPTMFATAEECHAHIKTKIAIKALEDS